jgi:hypothetical protein
MTNGGEQGTERIHNDTLHSFHSSPTTVKMIKQRRTGQAGHAACTGEIKHTKLQFENTKEEVRIRSCRWENNAKLDLKQKISGCELTFAMTVTTTKSEHQQQRNY